MPYRDHSKKSDSVKHWTGLFLIEIPFSLRQSLSVAVYWRVLRTLGGGHLDIWGDKLSA